MYISMLLVVFYFIIITLMTGLSGSGVMISCFDPPTLMIFLFIVAASLTTNHAWGDFLWAFRISYKSKDITMTKLKKSLNTVEMVQKTIIYAAIMLAAVSTIAILKLTEMPRDLGPAVSVMVLSFLYMSIFELFLLPVHANLTKIMAEYMEGED